MLNYLEVDTTADDHTGFREQDSGLQRVQVY